MHMPDKPLIIQSDGSILLEVFSGVYEEARDAILPFAELIKSPEYVHTYRITPLSCGTRRPWESPRTLSWSTQQLCTLRHPPDRPEPHR
jgi:hypothetical protein